MKSDKIFMLLFIFILQHLILYSQEFKFHSQLEGNCNSVALGNNYAYFLSGGKTHILDLTDANNIKEVGSFNGSKLYASDVKLHKEHLFLGRGGVVEIYSLDDPVNPVLVKSIDGYWDGSMKLSLKDSVMAVLYDNISIYNISNVESPVWASSISFDFNRFNCYAFNTNTLIGWYQEGYSGGQYFGIYDISDLSDPWRITTILLGAQPAPRPESILIKDNLFFMAINDDIRIYDISQPVNMTKIGGFAVKGYVQKMRVKENKIFAAIADSGLFVYDFSDIDSIKIIGGIQWPTEFTEISVNDKYIAVSAGEHGLRIFDYSDISNLKEVYSYYNTSTVNYLKIHKNMAILNTEPSSLNFLDISDVDNPTLLSKFEYGKVSKILAKNDILYIKPYEKEPISVMDISDPRNPTIVDTIPSSSRFYNFDISENYFYCTTSDTSINIFDISILTKPKLINSFKAWGYRIKILNNRLLTSYKKYIDGRYHIFVDMYDISDINNCTLLDSKDLGELADDVYVRDLVGEYPYLVIGCEKGPMLARIDYNDKIEIVDQFTDRKYYHYFYDGSYIYCFGYNSKTFSINKIDNKLNFISDLSIYSGSMDRFGNYLYLAQEDRGYVIYEVTDPLSIAIEENYPEEFRLFSIYPNPFNNQATIKYELEKTANIRISIYDIVGRKLETLVDKKQNKGIYNLKWKSNKYSSGIYFVKLEKEGYASIKKCILLK